jgi:nitrogen-specific signal transduction histidine kinase
VGDSREAAAVLVFAIAHEIGNHLGAIRLQAHLLDEDLDARSLAETSVAIDEMVGRSGPLLTLLRPLLTDDWRASSAESWSSLLGRVEQQIEDEGTRGVRFEIRAVPEQGRQAPDLEWLHPLLISMVGAAIAHVGTRGSVVLELESRKGETVLILEDDGPEEDLSAAAAYRGRPLTLAIARELVGRAGGRIEVKSDSQEPSGRTRTELIFPAAN